MEENSTVCERGCGTPAPPHLPNILTTHDHQSQRSLCFILLLDQGPVFLVGTPSWGMRVPILLLAVVVDIARHIQARKGYRSSLGEWSL